MAKIHRMTRKVRRMPAGTRLLLALFVFAAVYSLFHLAKGLVAYDPHLIIDGAAFTAVSVPLVLICWHADPNEPDRESPD